jgi:integrase
MPRETYRKIITSPELWEKVNIENKKLMDRFLREKNARSSDMTIKGYRSDLEIFFTWNLENNDNKFFIDIKKIEFSDFFSYAVEELQWNGARFGRAKSCLSSFSNFIEKFFDSEHPNFRNVILKSIESLPKNAVRDKTVLSDDQVENIFKQLEDNEEFQIICWFALAIGSGSRFSELLRFTTDIIDENNTAFDGLFLETLKQIKTKGRTKSGKMITKYIIKDIFLKRYNDWLIIRENILNKNNKNHNYIFIKSNGDPAKETTVRGWVEKIEKILGIPFYPHANRHYFTTFLSKAKLPEDLIQEICGWTDSKMIKLYNDSSIKDRSFSELGNLKNMLDGNKDK